MYRVMIIDDEKALRNLLKASVDWQEMGLEVVGEAASGIEAINIIDKLRPDIIFVDIRMPFMDGIEFSKIALKRYRQMKIIILTAFDEFEYAKQCIGLGITDYLLKPIVRTDIREACQKRSVNWMLCLPPYWSSPSCRMSLRIWNTSSSILITTIRIPL